VFLVQLWFHSSPILKCTSKNIKVSIVKQNSIQGVCMVLALVEREKGKLASVKLGVLSNPMELEPMGYDA
jgi:hypothetical protein